MTRQKSDEITGTLKYMKKRGSLKILIVLLTVGIALLIIGASGLLDKEQKAADGGDEEKKYSSFFEYKGSVEEEVQRICESVSGVDCIGVVVTFDGVGESIYATNLQKGSSERVEYVVIGSGSSSHALYLGESLPEISGIGVVCRMGEEGKRNEIISLLSAAYGLSMTRVYVAAAD